MSIVCRPLFVCVQAYCIVLTDNNLCSLQIAKLKQQLQQRSKPTVSGGHDKDRQRCYPQGSCSLGTTQVLIVISTQCTVLLTSYLHVYMHFYEVEGEKNCSKGVFSLQPATDKCQLFDSSKRIRKLRSSLQEMN